VPKRRIRGSSEVGGSDWADEMEDRLSELEDIEDAASALGLALRELPPTFQVLKDLDQERLNYWHVHASQLIHATPIGLEQRSTHPKRRMSPFRIALTSDPEQVVQVRVLSAEIFLGALDATSALLAWDRTLLDGASDGVGRKLRTIFHEVTGRLEPDER
jgi:hypothetical protein